MEPAPPLPPPPPPPPSPPIRASSARRAEASALSSSMYSAASISTCRIRKVGWIVWWPILRRSSGDRAEIERRSSGDRAEIRTHLRPVVHRHGDRTGESRRDPSTALISAALLPARSACSSRRTRLPVSHAEGRGELGPADPTVLICVEQPEERGDLPN